MTPPETCGDCGYYNPNQFMEGIGSCGLCPASSTRRTTDNACGMVRLLLQVLEEMKGAR
jgi:hypothetical protein